MARRVKVGSLAFKDTPSVHTYTRIVLLDDDPLMSGESRARDWTCVYGIKDMEEA